jgi:hypothetical protein
MSRPQFIHLAFLIAVAFVLTNCKSKSENIIPNINFKKGAYIGDPLFVNNEKSIAIIESNLWDDSLKTKGNKSDIKPQNILLYNPYININRKYGTILNVNTQELYTSQTGNFPLFTLAFISSKVFQQTSLNFSWNPILETGNVQNNRLVIALFKDLVKISPIKNEILNKEDIVWMGFEHKSPNSIDFLEGKMVEFDKLSQKMVKTYTPKIENLDAGIYVWAVWAYNKDGTKIVASSREIPFSVTNL